MDVDQPRPVIKKRKTSGVDQPAEPAIKKRKMAQPTTSSLYQVRLTDRDVANFQSPQSQPLYNPVNCVSVSSQLLGIVTPGYAEYATEMRVMPDAPALVEMFGRLSMTDAAGTPITVRAQTSSLDACIRILSNELFEHHATLIGGNRITGSGHMVVVGKDNGVIYVLDPQSFIVSGGGVAGVMAYFTNNHFTSATYFIVDHLLSESDYDAAYVSGPLASNLSNCMRIMGGKRRKTRRIKKSTRRRLTRGSRHPR